MADVKVGDVVVLKSDLARKAKVEAQKEGASAEDLARLPAVTLREYVVDFVGAGECVLSRKGGTSSQSVSVLVDDVEVCAD